MYALSVLGVDNYPPINDQIEMFNVLLPSKAYPVIAPIFNTFYVNGIYIMVLFSFERFYTISVLPKRRYLSLKRIKISIILVFLTSAVYSIPMFFETTWKIVKFKSGNFSIPYKTSLVSDYSTIYYRLYKSFGGMMIYFVIPVICFLVFNRMIIKKVSRLHKKLTLPYSHAMILFITVPKHSGNRVK